MLGTLSKSKLIALIQDDLSSAGLNETRSAFELLINSTAFNPQTVPFSENLTFEDSKNMVAVGSSEDFIFTADLSNSEEGNVTSIKIPAGVASTIDFTDAIFEIRRNDFDNTVDCIIYCSYEFGKVAVSILPKVQV